MTLEWQELHRSSKATVWEIVVFVKDRWEKQVNRVVRVMDHVEVISWTHIAMPTGSRGAYSFGILGLPAEPLVLPPFSLLPLEPSLSLAVRPPHLMRLVRHMAYPVHEVRNSFTGSRV